MLKPKQKRYLERAVEEFIRTQPNLPLEEWFLRHHPEVLLSYLREKAQGKRAKGEVVGRALAAISEGVVKKDEDLLSGAMCLLLKGISEDVKARFGERVPAIERALTKVPTKLRLFVEFENAK
jgi:hypothetical protein